MTVYTTNLLLILGLAYPLCIWRPSKPKKIVYLALTLGYMWFLAAFRYDIGFDYDSYLDIFNSIAAAGSIQEMMRTDIELGFLLLTKGMTAFADSAVVIYGVYAAVILIPLGWFIYSYCKDAWLSVWLYVTLAHFYASMNFIRQSIACSVALLGYKFLRDKKPVPYFIVVLLAMSFHKSAIILFPVYFLCHIRLDKKMGILYGSAAVVLYFSSSFILDKVTDHVFTYYKGTYWLDPISEDPGYAILFLIVPLFLFGACLALRHIWEQRDKMANPMLNMMLFSMIIWLFITKHFILERFSQYMYIYAILAVPAAIACLKVSDEEKAGLAELRAADKDKKSKSKAEAHKIKELAQKISDHEKYYWSAVAAVILLTWTYNEFGANVNGFHGVFPYQSVLDWLG